MLKILYSLQRWKSYWTAYNALINNWICKKFDETNYISLSIKDNKLRQNINKSSIKSATKF